MKHFIVIDLQNDFVTGTLANPAAAATIPYVKEKLIEARKNGDNIIFTRDTHAENYMETMEGKYLPVKHCVKGTEGWEIVPELAELIDDDTLIIDKANFGYTAWDEYIKSGDEVTICGTVSEICVVSNALAIKAIGEVDVTVLEKGCSGLPGEGHAAAMKVMASCQCKIA